MVLRRKTFVLVVVRILIVLIENGRNFHDSIFRFFLFPAEAATAEKETDHHNHTEETGNQDDVPILLIKGFVVV